MCVCVYGCMIYFFIHSQFHISKCENPNIVVPNAHTPICQWCLQMNWILEPCDTGEKDLNVLVSLAKANNSGEVVYLKVPNQRLPNNELFFEHSGLQRKRQLMQNIK